MQVMRRPLTARQFETLEFIATWSSRWGFPPTIREICEALEINSTNAVADKLNVLESLGLIERFQMMARGMRVTPLGHEVIRREGRAA